MTCERCGVPLQVGDFPFCPHGSVTTSIIGDEMDAVIENNGTPHPIRFRSKQALAAHMAAHGLQSFVRHQPGPGTDKSPHTSDWSRGIDAQTLDNVRVLVSRQSRTAKELAPAPLPVTLTTRMREDFEPIVVRMGAC
jgi:hypothetical protein